MSRTCPKCQILNVDTALRCDCGYEFPQARIACPYCAEPILARAVICKHCGRNVQGTPTSLFEAEPTIQEAEIRRDPGWKVLGAILLIGGLLAAVYFFAIFDPSVPLKSGERVNNIGLLADRQNGLLISMVAAGLGLVLTLRRAR